MGTSTKLTTTAWLILALVVLAGCSAGSQERTDTTFTSFRAEDAYERGIMAHREGDLVEAERCFDQAIESNPRYLAAYLGLGRVLLDDGRYREALDTFDQALLIREQSAEAHSGRAEALLNLDRAEEAAQAAEQAISLGADVQGSLIYAQALAQLERTDEAIEILEQVVSDSPNRTDIRIQLANLYLQVGRAETAVPLLERGARRDRTDLEAWMALAELYHQLEIWDRASETWEELTRMRPQSGYLLMRLGEAQLKAGSHLLAIQSLDQAIQADPTLTQAYILHGQAEVLRGYPDRAEQDAERALALDPDNLDGLLLLAQVQQRRDNPEAAIDTLRSAIDTYPGAFEPAAELAQLYFDRGEYSQVIALLEPHRHEIASHSSLNMLMVNAYLAMEDTEAALGYLVRMAEEHPDNAELHREVVQVGLEARGQTLLTSTELLEYAQRALQLSGGMRLEYRLTFIDALANDGQRRRALQEARRALEDIPNNPELLERIERLD